MYYDIVVQAELAALEGTVALHGEGGTEGGERTLGGRLDYTPPVVDRLYSSRAKSTVKGPGCIEDL